MTGVKFPVGAMTGFFLFATASVLAIGVHRASYPVGTGSCNTGLKRPGCESDNPFSFNVKINIVLRVFMVSCLFKYRGTYTVLPLHLRGCIQTFPDWVITKYTLTFGITL
jgi:hypothetical protein